MTRPQTIHGVDISHHQSASIGWAALKAAGVKWMYHKATEGASFVDKNYDKRRAEAKKAGIPFGAYHFARPGVGDAETEARFFIRTAKPVVGDLRPCLDLETMDGMTKAQIEKWADQFCNEVEKLTGVVPVVYTPYTLSPALEKKALFWVPRYNNSNLPPTRRWHIWQFSDGQLGSPRSVKGLGNVDLNTSKVDVKELLIPPTSRVVLSRGTQVDAAVVELKTAIKKSSKPKGRRAKVIKRALGKLKKIPKKKR